MMQGSGLRDEGTAWPQDCKTAWPQDLPPLAPCFCRQPHAARRKPFLRPVPCAWSRTVLFEKNNSPWKN